MAQCQGRWRSWVDGNDDGTLDLSNRIHIHDNANERFVELCVGSLIYIQKLEHNYNGRLEADGLYHGWKSHNPHLGRGPFDEPTDGTWTAQGPIIDDNGHGKPGKAKSKTRKGAKQNKKSRSKEIGRAS